MTGADAPPGLLERPRTTWLVGLVLALVVVGPALGPGLLLNLDLVATADPPVPSGVWGLGPELPRGIPYQVPLAWAGNLLDGALVAKAVMVLVIVLAFAGAHRLAAGAPALARIAAGVVYAAGPFLATRLAIGHVGTALAAALMPWAMPTLLRPGSSLRRTFLWCAALGFCGINGGLMAGVTVLVGLVADRGRRAPGVIGVGVLGQLPWLVPGIVVTIHGVDPAGAENFGTRLDGVLDLVRLAGGQGYFIADFDVGEGQLVVPLAASVVVAVAVLGWNRLPEAWGRRAAVLAGVGFVVAAASGIPGVERAYAAVVDTPLGLPLREGHRMLPLFLVAVAPASAHGWGRLRERVELAPVVGLAVAVALVGPSLWGFGGQVEPVDRPPEFAAARRAVDAEPGPALALPFGQYVRPNIIDTHLVHQPIPSILGGDVILASGRGEEDTPLERADPRLPLAAELVERLQAGEGIEDQIRNLGLRWVAVLDTADPTYDDLEDLPGGDLEVIVEGPDLTLYRTSGAYGPAELDAHDVDVDSPVSPLAWMGSEERVTWYRAGSGGWLRGLDRVRIDPSGNLDVPAGSWPVFYVPSLLVLLADGVVLGAVIAAVARNHRS